MASIWAYLGEGESQAGEGICGQPNWHPHAQDHLKRNLYSGLPSLAPLCSPGSPICIATRRPLRRWRGPPQAAHHPAWVRAPPKPISCPLQHSLMSRCDCSRCGLGAWVSEWRGGVGRAGTDSFLLHSSPQSLLYHSVFPLSTLNLRMRPART